MFSVSPAEILTIAVIALLVFGPRRLPEIARRAGKVLRDLREAANELKTGIETEYEDVVGPLTEATKDVTSAITDLGSTKPPPRPSQETSSPPSTDEPEAPGETAEEDEGS